MDLPPDPAEHPEENEFASSPEPEPKKKVRRLRRRQISDSTEGPIETVSKPKARPVGAATSGALAAVGRSPDAVESDDPLVGSIVDGKYKVIEPLGSGAMSTVYKAWHLMLEKYVALKFIKEEASQSVSFRERFFREARIACELRHKNVVQAMEFGETPEGKFFLLMDYCPGRSLVDVLTDEGKLEPRRAAGIIAQVLDALHEAHENSIVHRDVKPSNIMVGDEDMTWLLDFGLAKSLDRDDTDTAASKLGMLVGTPDYMSPEQAKGAQAGPPSDVYSAGAVLYELVCGSTPFAGPPLEQIRARITQTPSLPSQRVPDLELPTEFENSIMRALAREEGDRWPSAGEFRDALQAFANEDELDVIVAIEPETFTFHESLGTPARELRVHRVRHKELEREGLVWIAPRGKGDARQRVAEFGRRLELAQRVEHPSLAPLVEGGPYAGERLYAFTAWDGGETLRDRIKQGPLGPSALAELGIPILEALAKAHEFGLTHGALNPSLVTLSEAGPVIHGLGIASATQEEEGVPQQDVRLVGRLFFQLLSGALEAEVGPEVVRERGLEAVKPPLWELLVKATGADPFPNAGAFLEALKLSVPSFADEPPPSIPPETARRLGVGAVTLVLLALLFGLISTALQPEGSLVIRSTPEARVEITGVGEVAEVSLQGKVPEDGFARFPEVPAGRYLVVVRGEDGSVQEGTAEVLDGQQSALDLALTDTAGGLAGASGATATIERSRAAVQELREKTLELLGDGSAPRKYALAEAALVEAKRVESAGQPLLKRVEAWETCRQAFEDALSAAQDADPRLAADQARAESAELMLRLTRAELKAADAEWAAGRSLLGPEGYAAARNAEARYLALSKLAAGRDELVNLFSDLRANTRAIETHRAEALRSMADVTNKEGFQAAEGELEQLNADVTKAPDPLTIPSDGLEPAKVSLKKLLGRAAALKTRWLGLAEAASDVNAIRDVIARLSGAIVRKDLGAILKLYDDPGTDRYFFETTLRQGEGFRFRAAPAVINGQDATSEVEEFKFTDTQTQKLIERTSFRIQLQKVAGTWKIRRVRQVAR